MRSTLHGLVDTLRNSTPVSFVPKGFTLPWLKPDGAETQMKAYGTVGTLFSIVHRTSNATSQVNWRLWRQAPNPIDRVEVTSHAALDVWNRPNAFMTRQELVEVGQQHIDLTGEGWIVAAGNPRFPKAGPLELWPVRPDRMAPVPHSTEYLSGYVYTGPNGEQVPLRTDSVLFLRMPNPLDPYRGLGPVQAALVDLDSSRYSAEWNRNFFLNSAEPGGIIEVDKRLTDDEFNELTSRWREQHQGIAQAHRVAVLEQGKWVDKKYTQKDMQFVELRTLSRDFIREAFGISKFALGDIDDVNRASAVAAADWFARYLTLERLERWKGMLNADFLPLFGTTAKGLEFDYDSPIPDDPERTNAERESKANAAKTYIDAGAKAESVKKALDLPEALQFEAPQPAPAPPPPANGADAIPAEAVTALLRTVIEARDERPFRQYWS
ncbi:MAG: phage portal protein [Micromonosporaceae bacterium]